MKWITRSHVHVDRVACPWLITRFIDSEAEFHFVPRKIVLERAEPDRRNNPGRGLRTEAGKEPD
jgi:hypothetical protein